jgi:hypothetical protein
LSLLSLDWAWQRILHALPGSNAAQSAEHHRLYQAFKRWVWPEFQMRLAMLQTLK